MLRAWSMVVEQAKRGTAEDVGIEPLLSVLVLEGLVPVHGSELENAAMGPARQEAEEVAQVGPRLDVVQLAAREKRDESGVDLSGVVGADEEPVLAADGFAAQRALGAVIVDGQATVVEKPFERRALVARVADRLGRGRLVEGVLDLALAPFEEGGDDRLGLLEPGFEPLLGRGGGPGALVAEESSDEGERLSGALGIGQQRLEPVPAQMRPARDLDEGAALVEVVENGVRVSDEVALVAVEQPVDGRRVVLGGVAKEHVALGRDDDPEVATPTFVASLDQDAGRVRAQIRRGKRVRPHRVDERLREIAERLVPAADRRAREVEPLAAVDALEPMQRQVILPATDDRVGEQAGAG